MNSIIKNKQFVAINGIDHFVTTYSTNEDNEVVIYVHGGPLQPDTSLSHILAKAMSDKYTLVFYSQRGSLKQIQIKTNTKQIAQAKCLGYKYLQKKSN